MSKLPGVIRIGDRLVYNPLAETSPALIPVVTVLTRGAIACHDHVASKVDQLLSPKARRDNRYFIEKTRKIRYMPSCVLEQIQPGKPIVYVVHDSTDKPVAYALSHGLDDSTLPIESGVCRYDPDFAVYLTYQNGHYSRRETGF